MVSSVHMLTIIEYCQRNIGREIPEIPKPLPSDDLLQCNVSVGDFKFITAIEIECLFKLILATNYLDCESLLKLCAAAIAAEIKKNPMPNFEDIPELKDVMGDGDEEA